MQRNEMFPLRERGHHRCRGPGAGPGYRHSELSGRSDRFHAAARGRHEQGQDVQLIPEVSEGKHSNWGTIAFALGFVLMMILNVTLG